MPPSGATSVPYNGGGWKRVFEPFTGAWQRNIEESRMTINTYPTLYACVSRISSDGGKLPFKLIEYDTNGVWREVSNTAYSPVLEKPNDFQTQNQFREAWLASKLLAGNTYVLKRRDARGVVNALYVLDPDMVMPMVTPSGAIYYQIKYNQANSIGDVPETGIVVPAKEIIHDRAVCMFHPLVGVSPLAAAYLPVLKNTKILKKGIEEYSANRPFGILTGPAAMNDDDAQKTAEWFAENWDGFNVAAIGADLKFTPFAGKATDAQMVEQMKYSDEQICQPFGMPPFMLGIGSLPAGLGVDGLYLMYYTGALQAHLEHMERLLTEGLNISKPLAVHIDTTPLLRMDERTQVDIAAKEVQSMMATPNEARKLRGRGPIDGGDAIYGQMQDIPLGMLATRTDLNQTLNPSNAPSEEDTDGAEDEQQRAAAITDAVIKRVQELMA